MKYNIWNKWDPLKVCMLGNNYAPEFFNGVNDKVADPLKRICEETLEDLAGFKTILQDFSVEVIQPELDPRERFLDNPGRYPRGPLQPRDKQIILGNDAYITGKDHPEITKRLHEYGAVQENIFFTKAHYQILAGDDYPTYEEYKANYKNKDFFKDFVWDELQTFQTEPPISSADTFMIGTKLYAGNVKLAQYIEDLPIYVPAIKNFDVTVVEMDGHSDANYHPIKPGAILSLFDVQTYEETFPGWDVCYLPDQSWEKVKGFKRLKKKNAGKWWLAGEEGNNEFTHFVETWLQDWVGYVEETVFDVNVLMLDEHHCCVSNPNNAQVNEFLKKHKVEPVYVPWRHRYFWDGGLHCITLDLYREGVQKEYF
jgi:hypothetical protein